MMLRMNAPLHKIGLALGSNVGDRLAMLRQAKAALQPYMTITAVSPIYETQPRYVTDQPPYLNAVLLAETALEPQALLYTVRDVEIAAGRQPTYRYGPKALDIDILFYDDRHIQTPELILPHPRLAERSFVLRPLVAIAPTWAHPVTGLSAVSMLETLGDQGKGERILAESL